ncbi:MAG: DUF4339 domain-containing protein, partial [Verrucomicrobiaceae bacterium]
AASGLNPDSAFPLGASAPRLRYWAYLGTEVKGPFSIEQLSGLLTAHVADDTTLVCLEGTEDWKGFYEIPELASLLP